jgi:hypothetical protein
MLLLTITFGLLAFALRPVRVGAGEPVTGA